MMLENLIVEIVMKDKDYYFVKTLFGTTIVFDAKYEVNLKKGDLINVHTSRGFFVRGLDINGLNVFMKSDEELEQDYLEMINNYQDILQRITNIKPSE